MSVPHKAMRPALYDVLESGGGGYVLPPATSETLGGVKIGEGVEVAQDGTISVEGADPYILPPATSDTLGGVKIGEGVEVAQDGTISVEGADPYILPPATASTLGGVKIGEGVEVAQDGTISTDVSSADIESLSGRIGTAQSTADLAAEQAELIETETIPGINAQIAAINTRVNTINNTTIPGVETWISQVESTVETIQLEDIPRIETAGNQNTAAISTINNTTVPAINTRIDDVEAALSSLLTVANMTLDDITVNAGARKNNVFTDIAPSGYQVVGVKVINIQNATTGGVGRDKVFLSSWSTTGGGTALQVAVYNSAETAAKIKIGVDVLCLKGA